MKMIGLIGGMSWESSLEYYRILNEIIKQRLGGLHSVKCVLVSVDFAEIEPLQHQERWTELSQMMVSAAQNVERTGADFLILCTNTMHKLAEDIQASIQIPLLHIADATARKIKTAGIRKVGLLGTRFTMEQDFYRSRLEEKHHLSVLIPGEQQRELVHQIIYQELCLGVVRKESRLQYAQVIQELVHHGAQGIVLGCTEIEMLVKPEDSPVPLFPTTYIHAEAAVDYALG